jgi:hypothetical protein
MPELTLAFIIFSGIIALTTIYLVYLKLLDRMMPDPGTNRQCVAFTSPELHFMFLQHAQAQGWQILDKVVIDRVSVKYHLASDTPIAYESWLNIVDAPGARS